MGNPANDMGDGISSSRRALLRGVAGAAMAAGTGLSVEDTRCRA